MDPLSVPGIAAGTTTNASSFAWNHPPGPYGCYLRHQAEHLPAGLAMNPRLLQLLVTHGVKAVARSRHRSERTIRRDFERAGMRAADLVRRFRKGALPLLMSSEGSARAAARLLGFSGVPALYRFIRRECRTSSVRHFRRTL